MRSLCLAVGLALAATNALAADFGIGVSARSDDGWLYAPIDISKSFRVEPSVRYGSNELSIDGGSLTSQESETWELGVGVFGIKKITDAAHIYYGARLAYVDSETSSTQTSGFGSVIRGESTQDGYRIGPTLGVEYLFGGHFSIGGEASYTYLDVEGESKTRTGNFGFSSIDTEQTSQGTQTQLIFRYMF